VSHFVQLMQGETFLYALDADGEVWRLRTTGEGKQWWERLLAGRQEPRRAFPGRYDEDDPATTMEQRMLLDKP
jgi:hypothetical protein